MIFDRNSNKNVIALLGAGSMGTAIVRRMAAGKDIRYAAFADRLQASDANWAQCIHKSWPLLYVCRWNHD